MTDPRPLISILIPVFNEEENVRAAYAAVVTEFNRLPDVDLEILFTDNHSTDRTFAILKEIAAADPRVRVLRFAKNFGYQRSIFTGYLNARGDCAIQLDCDLQDPPSLIPDMLRLWREGNEVVYGIRRTRDESPVLALARRLFYRLINHLAEDPLPLDAGDFRLVDRKVLAELREVDDQTPYLRGLITTLGFRQVGFPYDRQSRKAGTSKFPFWGLVRLAFDGIINHSVMPLRFASMIGIGCALMTMIATGWYLAARAFFGFDWPAGFATTTILLLFSIALNGLFLGIIGEYLGRIYQQVKRRPLVVIENALNLESPTLGRTGK